MYSFSYLEPVCCSMSSSNCCFLTCIQSSQEAGQVVWYSHLFLEFSTVYCDPHRQRLSFPLVPIKSLPAMQENRVPSLSLKDPLEKGMTTHSSILVWRIHGQRSLSLYSPWGCKESDTLEQLTFSLFFFT